MPKHWCASFRFGHELCWVLVPALADVCAGCRADLGCYFCQRGAPHVHIARPAAKAAA